MIAMPDHPTLPKGTRRSGQVKIDMFGKILSVADRQPRALFRYIRQFASFKKVVAVLFDPSHIGGLAKRQAALKKMRDHLFEAIRLKRLWNIA